MIKKINYSTAIKQATFSAMKLDKKVIVYGLGVGNSSNIYGSTKGLKEKFGKKRVRDFPVAEKVYDRSISIPLYPSITDKEEASGSNTKSFILIPIVAVIYGITNGIVMILPIKKEKEFDTCAFSHTSS